MRYFRYKKPGKVDIIARKEGYAQLPEAEKRLARKDRILAGFASVLFFAVSIPCFAFAVWAIESIPVPESGFIGVLCGIGIGILCFIAGIASLLIGGFAAHPIMRRLKGWRPARNKRVLSKACEHLRNFYGLQEPCIVTKCFDCTDANFIGHDVCIFVTGNELRITADLKRGFANGARDLGCYALQADEVTLMKKEREGRLAAELKAEKASFLLGYRAKGFIERNFILKS